MSREELVAHMEPSRYIGRCPQQVEDFIAECITPVLEAHSQALTGVHTELKV